jgi:hypothetical protein
MHLARTEGLIVLSQTLKLTDKEDRDLRAAATYAAARRGTRRASCEHRLTLSARRDIIARKSYMHKSVAHVMGVNPVRTSQHCRRISEELWQQSTLSRWLRCFECPSGIFRSDRLSCRMSRWVPRQRALRADQRDMYAFDPLP